MGSKTRLSSYCTKRGDNTVNLVTSRKTNARLARPINATFTKGPAYNHTHLSESMKPTLRVRTHDRMMTSFSPP